MHADNLFTQPLKTCTSACLKKDVEWYTQPSKTLQISRQWPYRGIRCEIQNRFYLKKVDIMLHVFRLLLRICNRFNDRVFGWNQSWPLDDSSISKFVLGKCRLVFEHRGPKFRSNLRRCDFRTLVIHIIDSFKSWKLQGSKLNQLIKVPAHWSLTFLRNLSKNARLRKQLVFHVLENN